MTVRIEAGLFEEFFPGKTAGRRIHTGLDIIKYVLVTVYVSCNAIVLSL